MPSSFHLRWDRRGLPSDHHAACAAVSVTLEVLEPPTVPRLYFWALQADFVDAGRRRAGGAHLGLQWHPGHPSSRAVNWGGYRADGTELDGSFSSLASTTGNVNTRDLAWHVGRPYRLTIAPAPDEDQPPPDVATAWRGTVTDLVEDRSVAVRDLYVTGDRISSVVMWSEVFAECVDPSVAVRWSNPSVHFADGATVAVPRVGVNYESAAQGGCPDTDSSADALGLVQRTATVRVTAQGATLPVPGITGTTLGRSWGND